MHPPSYHFSLHYISSSVITHFTATNSIEIEENRKKIIRLTEQQSMSDFLTFLLEHNNVLHRQPAAIICLWGLDNVYLRNH